ncbi:MAG: hypothetical protein OXD42_03005, partial [Rhodospirillaceae bacterium]|nr:hypothetical protein [Rhodospirillaceae bacterium]
AGVWNGLRLVGREIKAMFLAQSAMVARSMTGLSRCLQRAQRPAKINAAKEQVAKPSGRLTADQPRERSPSSRPKRGAFLVRMPLLRGGAPASTSYIHEDMLLNPNPLALDDAKVARLMDISRRMARLDDAGEGERRNGS